VKKNVKSAASFFRLLVEHSQRPYEPSPEHVLKRMLLPLCDHLTEIVKEAPRMTPGMQLKALLVSVTRSNSRGISGQSSLIIAQVCHTLALSSLFRFVQWMIAAENEPVEHGQRAFNVILVDLQKLVHGLFLLGKCGFSGLLLIERPSADRSQYYATRTGLPATFWLRPEAAL